MDFWRHALTTHGYWFLAVAVFLDAIGVPIPSAIALMIAGGLAAHGYLSPSLGLAVALAAMLSGDLLLFLAGRYTGWWLLSILCRLSLNPEACILKSADSFYRRGKSLLVFAKFIPGINSIAPPLAGSMNMRAPSFIAYDAVGAVLYVGVFFGTGLLFSGALDILLHGYQVAGHLVATIIVIVVAGYFGFQLWLWVRPHALHLVRFVTPREAADDIADGAHIYDVRSHGYFDAKATRIKGSRRLDPNALHQVPMQFPAGQLIYLYCTCAHEATSARVAQELKKHGVNSAVIKGGLKAWRHAGLPIEPVPADEVALLPVFG